MNDVQYVHTTIDTLLKREESDPAINSWILPAGTNMLTIQAGYISSGFRLITVSVQRQPQPVADLIARYLLTPDRRARPCYAPRLPDSLAHNLLNETGEPTSESDTVLYSEHAAWLKKHVAPFLSMTENDQLHRAQHAGTA